MPNQTIRVRVVKFLHDHLNRCANFLIIAMNTALSNGLRTEKEKEKEFERQNRTVDFVYQTRLTNKTPH